VQTTLGSALAKSVDSSATLGSACSTLGIQDKDGVMIIDRVDANGNATATKTEVVSFEGTSGSTVTDLVRGLAGTSDADHAVGAVVEFGPDIIWAQGLIDTFVVEHGTDGTHSDITADSITPTVTKQNLVTGSDGATVTFDLDTGNIHEVTLEGNRILAISNEDEGQVFIIKLIQDATGSRTVTWFSTIKWAGGSAPTLTTTATKADVFGFLVTGTDTYDGFIVGQNV